MPAVYICDECGKPGNTPDDVGTVLCDSCALKYHLQYYQHYKQDLMKEIRKTYAPRFASINGKIKELKDEIAKKAEE